MMINMTERDIAEGTFLARWPKWLRWFLFLPSAIVVPFLFFTFQSLMQTWFLGISSDAFYLVFSRSVIYGGGFVLVGSMTVPRFQKAISLLLTIAIAMFAGIGIYAAILTNAPISHVAEAVLTLVSAGYATYYIFQEENK